MKQLVVLISLGYLFQIEVSAVEKNVEDKAQQVVDYNDTIDNVLRSVTDILQRNGGDPAALSDRTITFEYRPLLITYAGKLRLTRGFIQELSNISRRGKAVLSFPIIPDVFTISAPLSFQRIIIGFDFEMTVKLDTVRGTIFAWAYDATVDYNVEIVALTAEVENHNFNLMIGSLDIQFSSSGISNTYKDLITGLVKDVFRNDVVKKADEIVGKHLDDAILSVITAPYI